MLRDEKPTTNIAGDMPETKKVLFLECITVSGKQA
jgi:hypothetical protein